MGNEPPWLFRLRNLLFSDASIGWPWGVAACPATKVDEGLGVGRKDGPGIDAPLLLDMEVSGLKVTVFGPRGGSRDVGVEEEDAWFVASRGEDSRRRACHYERLVVLHSNLLFRDSRAMDDSSCRDRGVVWTIRG